MAPIPSEASAYTYALAPLLAAALWGGMYVVSKWGFALVPPVTLAFLRVALGAATLYAVVRARRPPRSFSRTDRRGFVVLALWVTVTMVTQFVGTELTNASQGALLTVLTPVFTLALGVVVLDEFLTRRKALGTGLALAGTALVLAGQYDFSTVAAANVSGVAALFLASFGWAVYTVRGKPLIRKYSALETATYSTLAATPMLAVLVPIELALRGISLADIPVTPPVIAAVLYLGVASTALAWYLWYKGLEYVDAGTVAVFFFAQPVVGAALGAALLGEDLGSLFVAGAAVMAAGIYLVSSRPRNA